MPSYCCAVNCKNNGFTNPNLSYFKFPEHRQEILEKWIIAMKRKNWTPTKYSRLCSIHFEEHCFFFKTGARLRLVPDAVPTIFDFRKLKSNRKKAKEYLDMDETDCPDPNLYDLEIVQPIIKNINSNKKCCICNSRTNNTYNNITTQINIDKNKKIGLNSIIESIGSIELKNFKYVADMFVCLQCQQRLLTAYKLKCEIEQNINETIVKINTNDNSCDFTQIDNNEVITFNDVDTDTDKTNKKDFIYCSKCDVNFSKFDISIHLLNCKMRERADADGISLNTRKLFACVLCKYLVYKHNAVKHIEKCNKNIKHKF